MLTQTFKRTGLKNLVAAIFTSTYHMDSTMHHSSVFQLTLTATETRKINFILFLHHRT